METSNIKNYAPRARVAFMDAVAKRLNTFGISANKKGELQVIDALVQGSVLQIGDNNFDSKLASARQRLVQKSEQLGYAQLVEQVAYTWFNRLCAIRYMEIHGYLGHGFRVLSHPSGDARFEILDHAQDAAEELGLDRDHIIDLMLAGDKNEELYRELLLGQCHKLHEAMPFLFESLNDETELLLPDNLTRTDSILRGLVDSIPEEDWQQVEVIGWLYQFYISDKKDEVIGKVVKSEDIPAATQLFTPNWIVKYLVQNSVGRHWLQTYPDSPIKEEMEYYIEPAEQTDEVNEHLKAITPDSIDPESIKVLDPASGSGHILIEAYNVLKAIYEERGYRSRDIPKLILENNIYGLDIDDRAAQLSGFSLMMMARQDDRRIFSRDVQLNVLSLQETGHLDLPKLWQDLNLSGEFGSGQVQDMFGGDLDLSSFEADNRYQLLQRNIERFKQGKTFGSLIEVPAAENEALKELYESLRKLAEQGDSIQRAAVNEVIDVVHQALILSSRYDAVVANPPYMGSKGMNKALKDFAKREFPDSKSDLFAMFMELGISLIKQTGSIAMIVMESWMFLSSYERLRTRIVEQNTIIDLVHMPYSGKGRTPLGINFGTSAFIVTGIHLSHYNANFSAVRYFETDINNVPLEFPVENELLSISSIDNFKRVPGHPIAYWLTDKFLEVFSKGIPMQEYAIPRQGFATGKNDRFLRQWYEVSIDDSELYSYSREQALKSTRKWFPCNKGGRYRKWFGNNTIVVNWKSNGSEMKSFSGSVIRNPKYYFREGITWSTISSLALSMRYSPPGFLFETKGSVCFPLEGKSYHLPLALMNTKVVESVLLAISPTLDFHEGPIGKVPVVEVSDSNVKKNVNRAIEIARKDWDAFEISWDFDQHPLLKLADQNELISKHYESLRKTWAQLTTELKEIEEENNKIFGGGSKSRLKKNRLRN
ncbi:BREX-1 system adenine-specific DNA-methyltransferase PglX [Psychrobacter sanguinis]|uniref:BREX-1 system adenine-specific DNA-methyltransferase PglX n=1 Tax=Psychrobacter sanguinis TaxID=861445 RepID=UPI00191979A3|nr:BREX-1 system adenine-specific DNA-methyltransferase PglX [Psychrobacter sanguinis]